MLFGGLPFDFVSVTSNLDVSIATTYVPRLFIPFFFLLFLKLLLKDYLMGCICSSMLLGNCSVLLARVCMPTINSLGSDCSGCLNICRLLNGGNRFPGLICNPKILIW